MGSSAAAAERTPAEEARDTYNNGIDHRDKAKKLEEKAATQSAKDQEKTRKDAMDEFGKALKDFQKAVQLDPTLYQAYNGMGYTYRKMGDYQKALENYDQALKMSPGFPDALEYRGEAYLGLNRLDDAKQAYLTLFGTDRKQADALLKAMAAYVAKPPASADQSAVTALDGWVKERSKLATTTTSMSLTDDRSVWK